MYRREEGHWPGEPSPFFCSNEIVPLLRREHFCNKPRRIFRKKGSHFQNQPQRVVPVCWSSSHPQLSNPSSRPWTRVVLIYRLYVCLGKSAKDVTFPILSLSKISNLIWFSVPVLMYNSCSQIGSSVFLQTCTIFYFENSYLSDIFSDLGLISLIFISDDNVGIGFSVEVHLLQILCPGRQNGWSKLQACASSYLWRMILILPLFTSSSKARLFSPVGTSTAPSPIITKRFLRHNKRQI